MDTPPSSMPQRPMLTLVRASAATTIAVLPVFLLGALAVLVREDLEFSETLLGAAVSIWYVLSSMTSVWGGRLSERLGANRAMVLSASFSVLSLLGIAAVANRWWHLLPFLLIGAAGNAMAHPTANLALARGMPASRMGVSFGFKQSAVPLASFVGGFAVPAVGLTLGWRWAFAGGALLAAAFIATLPRTPRHTPIPPRRGRTGDVAMAPLIVLGFAGGIGVMATNPLAIFYVESAVAQGFSVSLAGVALAFGSAMSIVFRVIWGWVADRRRGGTLMLISILATAGGVGVILLGQAHSMGILFVATVFAFGAGWGWAGLLQLAVVTLNPGAPAEATGIVMTFMRIGGTVGPLLIGALADRTSYGVTWLVGGALLFASAIGLQGARLLIQRDIATRTGGRSLQPQPRRL